MSTDGWVATGWVGGPPNADICEVTIVRALVSSFLGLLLVGSSLLVSLPRPASAAQVSPDAAPAGAPAPNRAGRDVIGGFTVSDDDAIPFYQTYRALGPDVVGFPISRRFSWDGFTVQAFQKVVMQWQPATGQVAFLNTIDLFGDLGHDGYLEVVRSTPSRLPASFDAGQSFDQVMARRLDLLNGNPAIRAAYAASPAPMLQYGLPTSPPVDNGSHIAMRFQRVIIQQWKVAVPWAEPGQVTIANGGVIAKELGLLPAAALQPDNGSPGATLATVATTAGQPAAPPPPPAPPSDVPTSLPSSLGEAEGLARFRSVPVWQLFIDVQCGAVARNQPPIALPDVTPTSLWDTWAGEARMPTPNFLQRVFFCDAPTNGPLERQAEAEVNRLRAENGQPPDPLQRAAVLAARCQAAYDVIHRGTRNGHEQSAGTTGFCGQWPPDRARFFGARDVFIAENLHGGRGPGHVLSVFMGSPAHRANVLIQHGGSLFPALALGYAEAEMGSFKSTALTIGSCVCN